MPCHALIAPPVAAEIACMPALCPILRPKFAEPGARFDLDAAPLDMASASPRTATGCAPFAATLTNALAAHPATKHIGRSAACFGSCIHQIGKRILLHPTHCTALVSNVGVRGTGYTAAPVHLWRLFHIDPSLPVTSHQRTAERPQAQQCSIVGFIRLVGIW